MQPSVQRGGFRRVASPMPLSNASAGIVVEPVPQDSVEILADWFPVVRVLLWDDPFRTVAEAFVACQPATARGPCIAPELFPRHLRAYGNSSSIEYLADIADLECAYRLAQRPFEPHLAPADFLRAVGTERCKSVAVEFHPSVRLLQSRFPVVSIWEGIRSGHFTLQQWRSELTLVAKPMEAVQVLRLRSDEYLFLAVLARGRSVADGVEAATVVNANFGMDRALRFLAEMNIATGLHDIRLKAPRGRSH